MLKTIQEIEYHVKEDDPALGERCQICGEKIQVGDLVHPVETSQRRGDIEFNVDYVYYHSLCH